MTHDLNINARMNGALIKALAKEIKNYGEKICQRQR